MKRVLQIFTDGKDSIRYLNRPLLPAEQGNMQTLAAMARQVRDQRLQPDVRAFVLREIVGNVRGHDAESEIERCFEFARDRITYRRDPVNVERVADIWSTLYALNPNEPEGDCGIKSAFFAACVAAIGYRPFFVVIKQTPNQGAFNHVYTMVVNGSGAYKYFDPTPEGRPSGWETSSVVKRLYKIF